MPSKQKNDYPADWKDIATKVKAAASWRCVRCGHPDDPAVCVRAEIKRGQLPCDDGCRHAPDGKQRVLTVHHLDGDKSNCRWWNIPPLCQVCHLIIQAKVVMERRWMFDHSSWFLRYVAGYHAYITGRFDFIEYVEANIENLLEIGKPNGLRKVKEIERMAR